MMKKILKVTVGLLMSLMIVFAFAGCGGSAAPAEAPKEAAEAATEAVGCRGREVEERTGGGWRMAIE